MFVSDLGLLRRDALLRFERGYSAPSSSETDDLPKPLWFGQHSAPLQVVKQTCAESGYRGPFQTLIGVFLRS